MDLVGHVAYALYKRDKLKFCDDIVADTGCAPDADALEAFIRTCNLETRIVGYRVEAERLPEAFTEFQLADISEEMQREHDESLLKKLSEGRSLRRICGEALCGSFAVAGFWAAMVVVVLLNKYGPNHMLRVLTSAEVTSSPDPMNTPRPASSSMR